MATIVYRRPMVKFWSRIFYINDLELLPYDTELSYDFTKIVLRLLTRFLCGANLGCLLLWKCGVGLFDAFTTRLKKNSRKSDGQR